MTDIIAWALLLLLGTTVLYVLIMKVFVVALKPYFQKKD